jgi:hypothetical protein
LSNERNDLGPHDTHEKLSLQERKLLEHHETELRSPSHRFGPTVRIKLGKNGGDVKLSGVEGDSQPTCDGFVGDARARQDSSRSCIERVEAIFLVGSVNKDNECRLVVPGSPIG